MFQRSLELFLLYVVGCWLPNIVTEIDRFLLKKTKIPSNIYTGHPLEQKTDQICQRWLLNSCSKCIRITLVGQNEGDLIRQVFRLIETTFIALTAGLTVVGLYLIISLESTNNNSLGMYSESHNSISLLHTFRLLF